MELLFNILLNLYWWILRRFVKRRDPQHLFRCPQCHQHQVSTERSLVHYEQASGVLRPVEGISWLHCTPCDRDFNLDSFYKDPDGIYQLRTWDCPACTHLNPNTTFQCAHCGFKLQ